MEHLLFHDIMNQNHRSPFGAVAAKTEVSLSVAVAPELCPLGVMLRVWNGGEEFFDAQRNGELFTARFTPDTPGIYWYRFEARTPLGTLYCRPGEHFKTRGTASPSPESYESFQLTVYSHGFKTPEWTRGAVMYQIFPDRFARAPGNGNPDAKRLHKSWSEPPEYLPSPGKDYYAADDFFGGNLKGIASRLPYLKSLGVGVLYLNPVFRAYSNHRYDTGDYTQIDPLLGTNADFTALCEKAGELGIRVILDGVFSHTGSDSVYFNREGTYPGPGAYNSKSSPYFGWYKFKAWPHDYACWWDVWSLPEVDEENPSYLEFITGENGIAAKWLGLGASGWRLDVADELPDSFLETFRARVKAEKPDALIIGEVWEDASNKVSYGSLRRFLLGSQLDTVMNYPLRGLIIGLLTGIITTEAFCDGVNLLRSNYPAPAYNTLMNFLSTHDTVRITTLLGGAPDKDSLTKSEKAAFRLSKQAGALSQKLHMLAALIIYCLPGIPCIYYGDELALEGYEDPFNRAAIPENAADLPITRFYRALGELRREHSGLFCEGTLSLRESGGLLLIERKTPGMALCAAINPSPQALPLTHGFSSPILKTDDFSDSLPPYTGAVFRP